MANNNINLKNIKIVYSTCSKFPERHARIETQLNNIGLKFEKYEGSITETQWIGSCTNHLNILKNNMNNEPLLVIEDDVIFTSNFSTEIEFPQNTDAIFLGKSLLHLKEKSLDNNYYNARYTRLIFSFGLHGILYLSSRFKNNMLECFEKSIQKCAICDKLTGDILKNFMVISPKKCWLYQDNENNKANKLATEY